MSPRRLPPILAQGLVPLALLTLVACHDAGTRLPVVDLAGFEPSAREQVAAAIAAAEADPTDADALGGLGRVLHAYERSATAAGLYARARVLQADAFHWHYLHGLVLADLGHHEEALRAFRAATDLRADYLPAWLAVGESLLATERAEAAAGLYRKLLGHRPGSPLVRFGLGRALQASGDIAGAIEHLEQAVDKADYYAAAHYRLALLYRDLGEADKARQHLVAHQRHKGKRPAQQDPLLAQVQALNQAPSRMAAHAKLAVQAGDLHRAAELFEQAVAGDPGLVSARASLVYVYWRLGDTERAEDHYHQAVATDPGNAEAHLNWGMLLGSRQRLDEAALAFEVAIAAAPENATGHTFLGYIRQQQGRADEAMTHYREALDLEPSQPRANYLLGSLLLAAGDADGAASRFETSVASGGMESLWFLRQIAGDYRAAGEPELAQGYEQRADAMQAMDPGAGQ